MQVQMRRAWTGLTLGLWLGAGVAHAQTTTDPAAARAHLKQGYELKQQGKCEAAIPHFQESARLDPQPKAFINLAECEEKLGRLAAAQAHLVDARDTATSPLSAALRNIAEERLRALEERMPKLRLNIGASAPAGTRVFRDGVELGAVSLNVPLPLDPGSHRVVAQHEGTRREYSIELKEGETRDLEVTPLADSPSAQASTTAPPAAPAQGAATASAVEVEPGSRARFPVLPVVLSGVAVAGAAVGVVSLIKLQDRNSEIERICPNTNCANDSSFQRYEELRDEAGSARLFSIVGLSVGALAGGAAAYFWVKEARSESSHVEARPTARASTHWTCAPSLTPSSAGLHLWGAF